MWVVADNIRKGAALNAIQIVITSYSIHYTKLYDFNVLPQIDEMLDNGYSREEMKMVWETRKIFEDDGA